MSHEKLKIGEEILSTLLNEYSVVENVDLSVDKQVLVGVYDSSVLVVMDKSRKLLLRFDLREVSYSGLVVGNKRYPATNMILTNLQKPKKIGHGQKHSRFAMPNYYA